jgi:hypothetical protein
MRHSFSVRLLCLPGGCIGLAEFSDRLAFRLIYLHKFKAIMEAAAVTDFCADSQCGSQLQVEDSSRCEVLWEDCINAPFADYETTAS